jgi:hypothetical protein
MWADARGSDLASLTTSLHPVREVDVAVRPLEVRFLHYAETCDVQHLVDHVPSSYACEGEDASTAADTWIRRHRAASCESLPRVQEVRRRRPTCWATRMC